MTIDEGLAAVPSVVVGDDGAVTLTVRLVLADGSRAEPRLAAVRPLAAVPPLADEPATQADDLQVALARLSVREREVLGLLATGLSNGELARHLFISEATVKCHVARVLTKLGARDRVQAVIVAFRSGLAGG